MEPEKTSPEGAASSPLTGILSALMSNPDLLKQIQSAFGASAAGAGTSGTAEAASTPAEPAPESAPNDGEATAAGSFPPVNDGLATVLSDPELMAKLPQMMAMLKPMLAGAGEKKPSQPHPSHPRSSEDCRNDLLLALKPFLSPERRNAVDAMLRISKLGTVIRQIK